MKYGLIVLTGITTLGVIFNFLTYSTYRGEVKRKRNYREQHQHYGI